MGKSAVKLYSFARMTRLTKRLKVGFIIEEYEVSLVRNLVIDFSCENLKGMNFEWIGAERILAQKVGAFVSPTEIVAAFCGVWSAVACFPRFHAVTTKASDFYKVRTTRSFARMRSARRHEVSE